MARTFGAVDKSTRKTRDDKGKKRTYYKGLLCANSKTTKNIKDWYGKDIELTEKHKERSRKNKKIYHQRHKKQIYFKHNQRLKADKHLLVRERLRNLSKMCFYIYCKKGKIMSSKKYGIDYQSIIEHLKPFPENIKDYHIDHIRPLCSFQFLNSDGSINDKEIQKAFAPENHQWLLAKENQSKGGRWKQ